jgi:hypothetical protein
MFGTSSSSSSPDSVATRPFGLTLITAYDGIMIGIVPSVLAYVNYFGSPAETRPTILAMFGIFLLSAGVIFAAASAWRGENIGRFALLGLVTIYYVGLMAGADVTVDLSSYLVAADSVWETRLRIARSLFWIGLHGWYFLFGRAADFFAAPYHR